MSERTNWLSGSRLKESTEDFALVSGILEQLSANLKDVFWIETPDSGKVFFVTPSFEDVWGRPCAELYRDSKNWLNGIHPDDLQLFQNSLSASQLLGQAFSLEYRIVRPDGMVRWILDRRFPIRDDTGAVRRYCGLASDITKQKAPKSPEESESRLAIMQQREDLMAAVMHDVKNPLSGANLVLEQLIKSTADKLNDEQANLLSKLLQTNKNLLLLIQNLIEVYRYEKDPDFIRLKPLDLVPVVQSFETECAPVASGLGIELIYILPEQPVEISGDTTALRRVIQNLVDNALKFSPRGGQITVQLATRDNIAVLSVTDTGPGIPERDKHRIFQKFWQSGQHQRYSGGTGLGLYLSARLVESHHGQISYETVESGGAKFTVLLPLLGS